MSIPFSLRIDEAIKAKLDAEAQLLDRSSSYLAVKAIEQFVEAQEIKRKAIDQAVEKAEAGDFISESAMDAWVDSWESGNELSPPEPNINSQKSQ